MAASAPLAQPVSALGLPRLPNYFPSQLLSSAQIVVVPKLPFPPVSALGLPEFEPMAQMSMAGITFQDRFFAIQGDVTESLCAHELVHVVQWMTLGVDDFLLTYALGLLEHGYEKSPLEAIAYAFQAAFEAGQGMPRAVQGIIDHARSIRDAADGAFKAHGLTLGT